MTSITETDWQLIKHHLNTDGKIEGALLQPASELLAAMQNGERIEIKRWSTTIGFIIKNGTQIIEVHQ